MKNQKLFFTTIILAVVHPTIAMNPTWQQTANKELFVVVKSTLPFSLSQEIKMLLDAGADPNIQDKNDTMQQNPTPLHYAARRGNEAACKLLLGRGANVDARTDFGSTPLMDAIKYPKILRVLLAHGAQVNALTQYKYNALFYAAATNVDSCVLLLEHSANPTIQSLENVTPLMNAACWYDGPKKDMCTAILTTQARINIAIRTALLCLNRLRRDTDETPNMRMIANELYRQFKTLLLPHLGYYIPLKKLLNMRNTKRQRPYDQLKIPCLDPANIDAIYAQNAITKQVEQNSLSDYSIQ